MTRETMLELVGKNLSNEELRKLVDYLGYIEYCDRVLNFYNLQKSVEHPSIFKS